MQRSWVLAAGLSLIVGMAHPTALFCQDNPTKESETYQGESLCQNRRGQYPHRVYTPDPEYDDKARKKRIQGDVVLSLIVTKEGKTADIKVTKTLTPGLDKQAIKAVSRWRFDPVIQDGQACPMKIAVEVSFKLY
jgi:TonB family protein